MSYRHNNHCKRGALAPKGKLMCKHCEAYEAMKELAGDYKSEADKYRTINVTLAIIVGILAAYIVFWG